MNHTTLCKLLRRVDLTIATNGCWRWGGGKSRGYGRAYANGRWFQVHRKLFEVLVGPIPTGYGVCHTCDIPSCVRPSHLFLGTQKENMQDCVRKHRHMHGAAHFMKYRDVRGEKAHYVVLTEAQVLEIRRRAQAPFRGLFSRMARQYHVTPQTICDILKRRSWKHV